MKKVFLILIASVVFALKGFGQVYVNGTNINDLNTRYCVLLATEDEFTYPVIYVDYGQKSQNSIDYVLSDNSGAKKHFNSDVDALNYMFKNGWELFSTRTEGKVGGDNRIYVFRKISN